MEIISTITLALSGLLLTAVGAMRLSDPIKNYAKNSGITLTKDTDLLNEMRGVSGVMLLAGILILLGIVFSQFTFSSHLIACLLFIGFAIGRTLSISTDGKPNKQIMQGLMSEIILGAANVFWVIKMML